MSLKVFTTSVARLSMPPKTVPPAMMMLSWFTPVDRLMLPPAMMSTNGFMQINAAAKAIQRLRDGFEKSDLKRLTELTHRFISRSNVAQDREV